MKSLLTLIFVLFASPVFAQTYYVRTGGSDSHTCGTGTNGAQNNTDAGAKQTIKGALACIGITQGAGAGKFVVVNPGTYTEGMNQQDSGVGPYMPSGSGPADANRFTLKCISQGACTIRNVGGFGFWNPDGVTNQNYYLIIDGFVFDGSDIPQGFRAQFGNASCCNAGNYVRVIRNEFVNNPNTGVAPSGDYFEFINNKIHDGAFSDIFEAGGADSRAYPIYTQNHAHHHLYKGNEFYNFPSFGLHLNSQEFTDIIDMVVDGNYFHDMHGCSKGAEQYTLRGVNALVLWHGHQMTAINNVFDCGMGAIGLWDGSTGNIISNNTINNMTGVSDLGPALGGIDAINDSIVRNNILTNIGGAYFRTGSPGGGTAVISNNFCSTAATGCTYTGNPQFVGGSGAAAFKIGSSSLAKDNGANISSALGCTSGSTCTDYAGTIRPQPSGGAWDIGAYEYQTTGGGTGSLVAHYTFDGGSLSDSSSYGNNLSSVGGVSSATSQAGHGQAVLFDGTTGQLTAPNSSSLSVTDAFTLEAWVNPNTATPIWRTILQKPYSYWIFGNTVSSSCIDGTPRAGFFSGGSVDSICGNVAIPANTWSHIAVTYDGSTYTMYKNAVPIAALNYSGTVDASTDALFIGSSGVGEFWSGLIDDVFIYNRALTQAEIQTDAGLGGGGGTTSVTWANDRGGSGSATGVGGSLANWTADIPLQTGANVITVTATDATGTTATDTITITRSGPVTDDFNRTGPGLGANWTQNYTGQSNFNLVSNALQPGKVGAANIATWNTAATTDHAVTITLGAFNTKASYVDAAALLRMSASPTYTGYYVAAEKGAAASTYIYRCVAGTCSSVNNNSATPAWGPGDTLKASITGNTITVYRNGSLVLTWPDPSPLSGTRAGVGGYAADAVADLAVDDFLLENLGPAVGTARFSAPSGRRVGVAAGRRLRAGMQQ